MQLEHTRLTPEELQRHQDLLSAYTAAREDTAGTAAQISCSLRTRLPAEECC